MFNISRFTRGKLPLTRIEAFSDGVFAIVVTLLVLELKVPELVDHGSALELRGKLLEQLPKFLSWLISFIIVCKFWLNHHYLLRLARHADYAMVWLNSIFLMFQSFVPFPTGLMGEYPHNALAASLFGAVMALNTVLFLMLQRYIAGSLLKPGVTMEPHAFRKAAIGPAFYLLGAFAAWWHTFAGFTLYAITPLFYITPRGASEPTDSAANE